MSDPDDEEGDSDLVRVISNGVVRHVPTQTSGLVKYVNLGEIVVVENDLVNYSDGVVTAQTKKGTKVYFCKTIPAWFGHNIKSMEETGIYGNEVSEDLMKNNCFPAYADKFFFYDGLLFKMPDGMRVGEFSHEVIAALSKHIIIEIEHSTLLEQKLIEVPACFDRIIPPSTIPSRRYDKSLTYTIQLRRHDDQRMLVAGFNGSVPQRTEIVVGEDYGLAHEVFNFLSIPNVNRVGRFAEFQSRHQHEVVGLETFLKEEHLDKEEITHTINHIY